MIKRYFYLPILSLIFVSQLIFAQHTYVRNLGTDSTDERGAEVIITSDHHYLFVGSTKQLNQTNLNIFLAKYTFGGELVWRKNLVSTFHEEPHCIAELNDGTGFIIGGLTKEFSTAGDWLIMRVDLAGNIIWKKFFLAENVSIVRKIFMLNDNNFVAIGQVYGLLPNVPKDVDGMLLKVNSNGDFLDTLIIPEPQRIYVRNAEMTRDGGFILCGDIKRPTVFRFDMYVVKINSSFQVEFSKTYAYSQDTRALSITQLENGEYFAVGTRVVDEYDKDPFVIRIDSLGNLLRENRLTFYRNDLFWNVQQRKDGKMIVVGQVYKNVIVGANSSVGVWILDTNGVVLSRNIFGSIVRHSSGNNFKIHNDTLLVITGYGTCKDTYVGTGYFFENAIIARTDTSGYHNMIYRTKSDFDFGQVEIGLSKQDTLFIINNGFHDRSYKTQLHDMLGVFSIPEGLTLLDTLYSSDTLRIIGKYAPNAVRMDSCNFEFIHTIIGYNPNLYLTFILKGEGIDSIIPVELSSFKALLFGNDVLLEWETKTELNNSGFELQRKIQGKEFEPIAFINGYGTTTEVRYYSFTDKNLLPQIYIYRLKQIDFDGTYDYSDEIEVDVNVPEEFILYQNYPNPFNPSTVISYQLPAFSKVSLKVYDILGNEVTTLVNEEKSPGIYEIKWDATGYSSGVYIYSLKAGEFSSVKKLVLMR